MITLDGVTKSYNTKGQPAINNISLHINCFYRGKQWFR